jgi:hypothetical protein
VVSPVTKPGFSLKVDFYELNRMAHSAKGVTKMLNRFMGLILGLVAVLNLSSLASGQTARPPQSGAVKDQKAGPAPAPIHDISGTWEPANGPGDGIQATGVKAMPNDGKPEHQLPYTSLGLATFQSHKALEGVDAVLPAFYNDPMDRCEPIGFPRADFYNLRQTQILQNEYKVVILYEYAQTWRVIWTDGRDAPKEIPEPRYYGYSAGKWADDTTLVVQTVGTMGDDKTWMDPAGRPVSDALHVEERFHRLDHDHLELTVTIDDPKMYTKPWVAMSKFPMKLQDPHTDVMEMYCSPSELEKYNRLIGNAASGLDNRQ